MRTYGELDAFLHTRGKPVPRKKVANNTHGERLGDHVIGVRFHDTVVVQLHRDGRYTLNSGGFHTVSTAARIEEFTPTSVRITRHPTTRRWMVTLRPTVGDLPAWASAAPFRDGMDLTPEDGTFTIEPYDTTDEDQHNANLRALVERWLNDFDGYDATKCAQCLMTPVPGSTVEPVGPRKVPAQLRQMVGDQVGSTMHLLDHVVNGEYPRALGFAASAMSGTAVAPDVRSLVLNTAKQDLRKLLYSRLLVGAVAPQHGRLPQDSTAVHVAVESIQRMAA